MTEEKKKKPRRVVTVTPQNIKAKMGVKFVLHKGGKSDKHKDESK